MHQSVNKKYLVYDADLGSPARVARSLRAEGLLVAPTPKAQRALVVYLSLKPESFVMGIYIYDDAPQYWMAADIVNQKAELLPMPTIKEF
jgi:hypothetical protein